jgi:hypothetical protein
MEASTSVAAHGAAQVSGMGPNVAGAVKATAAAGKATIGSASATGAHVGASVGASGAAAGNSAGSATASGMAKGAALALKGSLVAKSLAVVGVGVAGLVVAAHVGVIPAQGTVSLIPTWSSGTSLLGHLQAGLSGSSSGSGSGNITLGL